MKMLLKRMLLFSMAAVCFLYGSAQQKQLVSGTVKDPDRNPVAAATVKEKGTTNQVTSDLKGIFKISVNSGATLVVSSVGFATQEIAAGPVARPA